MSDAIRLWHDDIRRQPDGWVWARTNDAAKTYLSSRRVIEISMDHDMGLHAEDPDDMEAMFRGPGLGAETGLDLVDWMIENELVPEKVTIHSWNPPGASYMAARFNRAGYNCYVAPFVSSG